MRDRLADHHRASLVVTVCCALAACTPLVGMTAPPRDAAVPDATMPDAATPDRPDAGDAAPACPAGAWAPGSIDVARSSAGLREPGLAGFVLYGAIAGDGGSIYAFGNIVDCVAPGSRADAAVVRLTSDGRLDPTFGDGGRVCVDWPGARPVPYDTMQGLARDPRGRLVAVGYSQRTADTGLGLVLRLDADGRLDEGFGPGGVRYVGGARGAALYDAVAEADGVVLAGGQNHAFATGLYGLALRLRDDGTPDPAFQGGALRVDEEAAVYSAIEPVAGGYALAGWSRLDRAARVLRLDRAGAMVAGFGDGGVARHTGPALLARGLVVAPDGGYVVGGARDGTSPPFGLGLQRFDRDGRPDERFGDRGTLAGASEWDVGFLLRPVMAASCGGRIVVGAHDDGALAVVRVLPGGALDPGFGVGGVRHLGPVGAMRAVLVDPRDGEITAVAVPAGGGGPEGHIVALWRLRP